MNGCGSHSAGSGAERISGVRAVRGASSQSTGDKDRVQLRNVADAAGVHFVHQHSPTPEKYYVESAPGGLAVFDYNSDGRPDIFFTNGAQTPSLEKTSAAYANRSTATTARCGSPT